MKKILSFFAAMLVAVAVNAAETTLEPGSDVLRQAVKSADNIMQMKSLSASTVKAIEPKRIVSNFIPFSFLLHTEIG